ncbi:glucosamine-6-phosphate deaminase [Alkalihalobacillus sp. NPDC078783]
MQIIKARDYGDMSVKAAEFVIWHLKQNPAMNIGFATGGTPIGLYKQLVEDHKKNYTSYQQVTSFNLDEYIGLSYDHPQSYHSYMREHLFSHIDIGDERIFLPKSNTHEPETASAAYEDALYKQGGIDLQILGIGNNGHIGFNEPGTPFQSNTHIVKLEETTRVANARFFNKISEVPTHAITMGIASIMRSKEILLLISGQSKRDALHHLLHGKETQDFPASILKRHPRVTVIADAAARGE